ncbi:MAG: aldehyde dehydrogenase [Spirochaetaceae bacterium]
MEGQFNSYNPATGEIVDSVVATSIPQITEIVDDAHIASKKWREKNIDERCNIISKAFNSLEPYQQELSQLLSREMGKDIRRSSGEVGGTIFGGSWIASSAKEALQTTSLGSGSFIEYKPLGVVGVISPWNYPLSMANNLIVPSLIAGNAVVFKPSEETPLIAKKYVEYLNEHLPKNLLQIIYGDGEQGQALVESNLNLIAFTGSMAVGKQIMKTASSGLKRLVMELGGNDPMIVLEDADIEGAVRFAAGSSFENAGQMCIATERIYVHENIADKFEKMVTQLAGQYSVGPWDKPGVNIGPIINKKQFNKIVDHLLDAKNRGANFLLGSPEQTPPYIKPVVLTGMTSEMLMEEFETFGPVIAISRFSSIEDVIKRANNSNYGLGAVVFGKKDANRVADELEAGMIGINQGVGGSGDAPWVGAKQSGFGFHGSPEGHRQFAQVRVVNR